MSVRARCSVIGRRLWPVGLAGAVVAAALVVPSGAVAGTPGAVAGGSMRAARPAVLGTPTQVIDAKTDPDAAAQALNTGCADLSNCSWQTDNITPGYGPPAILGDTLYNCSTDPDDNAETAVGVSDERAETTSISEKVSLKLSLGLIGIADSSVEFEAFSKQAETFSTEETVTNAVVVPPGYKGYTTTQVLSANVTGSTYITEGINKLIQVKDIDLSFPGYQVLADKNYAQIIYNGIKGAMNADEIASRCDAVNDNPTSQLGATNPLGGRRHTAPTGSIKLALCQVSGACVTRKVTGPPPPAVGQATATLIADGRAYATGTDTAGRIRLTVHTRIRPGKYTLSLRESTGHGGRKVSYDTTMVPITVR